jgi:hypothetical protein
MTGYAVFFSRFGKWVKYQAYESDGVIYCTDTALMAEGFKMPEGGRFFNGETAENDSELLLNQLRGLK